MSESIFIADGDRFLPTEHARGPWDPRALHGGAPAALITSAFERLQPGAELAIGRLSFELLRPIPIAPLTLETSVMRPGRRVQELAAELRSGDELIARAGALRVQPVPLEAARQSGRPPGRVWMRLRHPLLPGEPLTPLARLAATADFGNGVSAALPFERYLFINADLTIHLERLPRGEWIGLDARTLLHENGVGTAEGLLHDIHGPLGRAFQTLVVQPR
jgi:hypothetical protein